MRRQRISLATNTAQSGAVLVISLIILLLLSIIGITAAQLNGLEEKMAGNLRDRNLAFQAAETALRAGEQEIGGLLQCPIVTSVGGFYAHTDNPIIDDSVGNVWASASKHYNYSGPVLAGSTSTAAPKYIIQCITSTAGTESLYRITARGTGITTDAVVMLQSTYQR
ncbi:MAG: PilX N-terminal domain-containing pilus assembly protein [Methylococcales bacterium]|nr:PilX N-terminal domain-containing pilus assembly protein [Methylococcales bacterium]